jgi:peptidoglycan/xylan/chitin deacetylase (PgdA/CDA1 family)
VTTDVCLTIDVEDWYDGMAVLGESIPRPDGARSGLAGLASLLDASGDDRRVTLFVVGNYLPTVAAELGELADRGHEVGSHGPDHGRLPEDPRTLVDWLRRGKQMAEDALQRPVHGFRSPRFDIPAAMELARYRDLVAEAGYSYVSDASCMGARSPVREMPVLIRHRVPVGGGSYQRLLPFRTISSAVDTSEGPAVLYYHSYDFGATLPGTASIRSLAAAKQLLGRGRVAGMFSQLLSRYGSKACANV